MGLHTSLRDFGVPGKGIHPEAEGGSFPKGNYRYSNGNQTPLSNFCSPRAAEGTRTSLKVLVCDGLSVPIYSYLCALSIK